MPPAQKKITTAPAELEFAHQLRDAVAAYLAAVDAWERKHGQTYRLPNRSAQITPDLEAETAIYRAARQALEVLVPRARVLYHRHGIRDPFNALLRVNLGAGSTQWGTRAAIGGNERTDVARGLVDLLAACAPGAADGTPSQLAPAKPAGILARIWNFFR